MHKNTQLLTITRRIVNILLVTIVVLCVSPAIAGIQLPEESTWAWGKMTSLVEKWDFESGKAHVSVKGSTFNAELFVGDNTKLVRFRLNGTIKGDKITVRAITLGSDVGSDLLSGKIVTNTYEGFADIKGDQTILLRDDIGNQIGLTRALQR